MLNKAILMGRLVRDPELRSTSSGTSVCSFAIAVERSYKAANKERETDFINCVAWGRTGEFIAKSFQKGKLIAVVGSIQTRQYEDRNGNKQKITEVNVDEANFCGDKAETAYRPGVVTDIDKDESEDDDLPFI